MSLRRQKLLKKSIIYLLLTLLSAFSVFPFLWMLITSFKSSAEILAGQVIPSRVVFDHYEKLFEGLFPRYIFNTFVVTSSTTILTVLFALPAAYAFSRFKFKGKTPLLLFTLFGQTVPGSVRFIPLYLTMLALGLLDTLTSLWIGYLGWLLPFSMWMLYGFLNSIPIELEEAAMIDGASRSKTMLYILLPLCAPGIVSVAIYCFISAWQEFMLANVFIEDPSKRTLTVGLVSFIGQYKIDWGQMMAGSMVSTLPVTIGFVLFQRWLISGLTQGAIKG